MCPPWAIIAQVSTCSPAGSASLLPSQISAAATQALASSGVAYSSLIVLAASPRGTQPCAASGLNAAGRHLLAAEYALGAVRGDATSQWPLDDLSSQGFGEGLMVGGIHGSGRQLMQFTGSPEADFNQAHNKVIPTSHSEILRQGTTILDTLREKPLMHTSSRHLTNSTDHP